MQVLSLQDHEVVQLAGSYLRAEEVVVVVASVLLLPLLILGVKVAWKVSSQLVRIMRLVRSSVRNHCQVLHSVLGLLLSLLLHVWLHCVQVATCVVQERVWPIAGEETQVEKCLLLLQGREVQLLWPLMTAQSWRFETLHVVTWGVMGVGMPEHWPFEFCSPLLVVWR